MSKYEEELIAQYRDTATIRRLTEEMKKIEKEMKKNK